MPTLDEIWAWPAGDDEDDLPRIGDQLRLRPTGWTERDRRLVDRALDLAGVADEAERVMLSMRIGPVALLALSSAALHAEAWLEDIRHTLARVAGGEFEEG